MDRPRDDNKTETSAVYLGLDAPPSRCEFQPDELQVKGDLLVERRTGIVIGRIWPGLKIADIESVTITSSSVEVANGRLVTCCSYCRRKMALVDMGLRKMHAGRSPVRNQPQCPECRGRYRK